MELDRSEEIKALSHEIRQGFLAVRTLRRSRRRSRIHNEAYLAAERELARLQSIGYEMGLKAQEERNA